MTQPRRPVARAPRALVSLPAALALPLFAACSGGGEAPGERDFHGPPDDELRSVGLATTCPAHLEFYPVGGPHNGGWDSNATTFTCNPHPGSSPDNSDFIDGDHYGNDLFSQEGTPAIAVVSGTISHSGWGDVSGNRVTIQDDCGWHYFSGHLETIAPGMTVGTWVTAGEVIGTVGDTGNAAGTQAHIHFSIYPESYNSGIDPWNLLQTVDGSACTGNGLQPGDVPSPPANPCTNANVSVDDANPAFAAVYGGPSLNFETGGGQGGGFWTQQPYAASVAYTVTRWGPDVPHTGLWELDAWIPNTGLTLNESATYDIAFHGGHTLRTVNQQAEKGGWVALFPGQPFKFVDGPRGYVGLSNLASVGTEGLVAFDAMRWRFIGPEGAGAIGDSCTLSNDCWGTLICGEAGTCQADCMVGGCSAGSCDLATGVCVLPVGEGEPLDDGSEFLDTDGDGLPNYLEGNEDSDGDGIINAWDRDSDNDGIDDSVEGSRDSDGDGTLDYLESDSDDDGIPDADEVGNYPDTPLDTDLDGIPDYQDEDSDNDGVPDWWEVGADPSHPADTDGDGTPDYQDTDSDGDDIPDSTEAGWEPEDPRDSDGDGIADMHDLDSDNDGLADSWEGDDNSDGDWLPDYVDPDSDNDGVPDSEDPDSDGDGELDELSMFDADPGALPADAGCACGASVGAGRDGAAAGAFALLLALGLGLRRRR